MSTAQQSPTPTTLVDVDGLTVTFATPHGPVRAVDDVSLTVNQGETFALVGESGCGKSTLAYALLGMVPPPGEVSGGTISVAGASVTKLHRHELDRLRGATMSMVFQGSMNAFNPVITIGRHVDHILRAHPGVFPSMAEGRAYFRELVRMVELDPDRIWRAFESQLSGGMKQRVAIAVALLLKPRLVILDEPTTALDVLNQRMVIDILADLREKLGLTVIFVTHDLAVVAELATRIAVMYAGHLVETGSVDEIFLGQRRHPYVEGLIGAIPSILDEGLHVRPIPGHVPNLADLPRGCRFAPRCPAAQDVCRRIDPSLVELSEGHRVACHVVANAINEEATS